MRLMRRLRRKAKASVPPAPEPVMPQDQAGSPPAWYGERTEAFLLWGRAGNLTPGQVSRSSVPRGPARTAAEYAPAASRARRLGGG